MALYILLLSGNIWRICSHCLRDNRQLMAGEVEKIYIFLNLKKKKTKKIHEAQEFPTPHNFSHGPPHKLTAARRKESDVSSNIFILSSTSGI